METFSALLALCVENSSGTGKFPTQRPVTRSFDVFFELRLNKRLSEQSWGWWFETPSCSLWRNCNDSLVQVISLYDYFILRWPFGFDQINLTMGACVYARARACVCLGVGGGGVCIGGLGVGWGGVGAVRGREYSQNLNGGAYHKSYIYIYIHLLFSSMCHFP